MVGEADANGIPYNTKNERYTEYNTDVNLVLPANRIINSMVKILIY